LLEKFASNRAEAPARVGGVEEDESGGGFFSRLKDMFT